MHFGQLPEPFFYRLYVFIGPGEIGSSGQPDIHAVFALVVIGHKLFAYSREKQSGRSCHGNADQNDDQTVTQAPAEHLSIGAVDGDVEPLRFRGFVMRIRRICSQVPQRAGVRVKEMNIEIRKAEAETMPKL